MRATRKFPNLRVPDIAEARGVLRTTCSKHGREAVEGGSRLQSASGSDGGGGGGGGGQRRPRAAGGSLGWTDSGVTSTVIHGARGRDSRIACISVSSRARQRPSVR